MRIASSSALVVVAVVGVLLASMLIIPSSRSNLASTPGEVHFTASGDFAARTQTTAVLNQIKTAAPDLHLALGDLSYGTTGQEEAWCNFVHATLDQGFPFELLSGNHESNGINGNINDFSSCLPNQLPGLVGIYGREWYVDVPQTNPIARFVMISPTLGFPAIGQYSYAAGTTHYQWTANTIDDARAKSIPWVVVGMHKPCLTLGEYQCDPGTALINLLMAKKVDLVLSGHEHLYQRTHQLATNAACPSLVPNTANAACIVDNDSAFTKGAGTVFATVGTGGTPLRDVNAADPEALYFAKFSGANLSPSYGSLDVKTTSDTLTAGFTAASGGPFSDSFTISPAGPAPNSPPTPNFTSNCTGLSCSFNGTGSVDTDGTISSYAWDFGDGITATGPNPAHQYTSAGTPSVVLTVTDDDGATASKAQQVTVGVPPNQPPVASFSVSCQVLVCSVNGSASTDADGQISSYSWDFGDGGTGTGVTAAHPYATAGTYPVKLLVTDDDGATNETTSNAAPTAVLAADAFTRTVTGGWGSLDTGGTWTISGSAAQYSVSSGKGRFRIGAPSGTPRAFFTTLSSTNTDLSASISLDKTPTGTGLSIYTIGRRIVGSGEYRMTSRFSSTGGVNLSLERLSPTGVVTSIQGETPVPGLTMAPGEELNVRIRVTGTNPTTVTAKAWKKGTTEPTTWLRTVNDSTAALQNPGGIGFQTYLSSGATNAPIVVAFDDLRAVTP